MSGRTVILGELARRRLSDWERNFLLLYSKGGPEAVVRDLNVRAADVETRLAEIQAKLEAPDPNANLRPVVAADAPRAATSVATALRQHPPSAVRAPGLAPDPKVEDLLCRVETLERQVIHDRAEIAALRALLEDPDLSMLDVSLGSVVQALARIGRGELAPQDFKPTMKASAA